MFLNIVLLILILIVQSKHNFYKHWEKQQLHITCFTAIFALLQRSGTNLSIPPRYSTMKKCKVKTTVEILLPIRIAIIKNSSNTKSLRGFKDTRPFIH